MPAYKYEALDANGRTQTGLLEADNPRTARAQLREKGLTPMGLETVSQETVKSGGMSFKRRAFGSTGLAVWTRQLAGLVGSGLPLERALTALADEAEDPRQRELLAQLKSEVNGGSTFARALASAPREFDDVYRGVVAAGEAVAPWASCWNAWRTTWKSAKRCAASSSVPWPTRRWCA